MYGGVCGCAVKLRRVLAIEFDEEVAAVITKTMPSKPLHGRWNAIGSTELKVRDHPELGKAFSIIAESTRAAADKAKALAAKSAASKTALASPGSDDDEASRENNKVYCECCRVAKYSQIHCDGDDLKSCQNITDPLTMGPWHHFWSYHLWDWIDLSTPARKSTQLIEIH